MLRTLSVAAALWAAGCSKPAEWRELVLTDAGLKLEMPAWQENSLGPEGRKYEARVGDGEYAVLVQKIPEGVEGGRAVLAQMRGEVVKWLPGGQVKAEHPADAGSLPGVRLELEGTGGAAARSRTVASGRFLVTLVSASKTSSGVPREADRFLGSLVAASAPAAPAAEKPAPAAPSATADTRSAWKYENAPQIFPDQLGYSGVVRKRGDLWIDEVSNGKTNDFVEAGRTPEYVEMRRPAGDFWLRLYADRSEYKFAGDPAWKRMFPGGWEQP